jgi:hypothetical protein
VLAGGAGWRCWLAVLAGGAGWRCWRGRGRRAPAAWQDALPGRALAGAQPSGGASVACRHRLSARLAELLPAGAQRPAAAWPTAPWLAVLRAGARGRAHLGHGVIAVGAAGAALLEQHLGGRDALDAGRRPAPAWLLLLVAPRPRRLGADRCVVACERRDPVRQEPGGERWLGVAAPPVLAQAHACGHCRGVCTGAGVAGFNQRSSPPRARALQFMWSRKRAGSRLASAAMPATHNGAGGRGDERGATARRGSARLGN